MNIDERALSGLESIGSKLGLSLVEEQIRVCRRLMTEGAAIPVAVLGRFKAGKSSFLNDIASREVLPVGVTPVTAVITRIRQGHRERATVSKADRTWQEVSFSELSAFISETGNPENKKQISSVEIEIPSLAGFPGLEFIDTPGLGSVFKHNTDVALGWLPNTAAALVAVSVDPPLSEQDLALIEELLRFTPRVSVLLTKVDLVSESQLGEILKFVSTQLEARFKRDIEVFPYSVKPGFESLRLDFKKRFLEPLVRNKSEAVQSILKHKILTVVNQCEDFLRVGIAASAKEQSEREALRGEILGEKAGLEDTREELRILAKNLAGRTRDTYRASLKSFEPRLLQKLSNDLETTLRASRQSLWKTTRLYDDWLRNSLGTEVSEISLSERPMFLAPLGKAQNTFGRAVRAFQDRLGAGVEEALGVSLTGVDFKPEIQEPSGPSISVGRAFESHLDLLSFLVPMSIFRGWVQRHFLRQLPYEVEKNLSRLASQWAERVNSAIIEMGRQSEFFIAEQVQSFERLLSTPTAGTADLERCLSDVREVRSLLESAQRN